MEEPTARQQWDTNTKADGTFRSQDLGKLLEYLQPLQQLFSPGKSGFYTKPLVARPGIEAGYSYSVGLIQLGTLLAS